MAHIGAFFFAAIAARLFESSERIAEDPRRHLLPL
jgi:hypothetical protein